MKKNELQYNEDVKRFLKFLNEKSDKFILTDLPALILCFDFDKEFDDIYLDAVGTGLEEILEEFAEKYNYDLIPTCEFDKIEESYMLSSTDDSASFDVYVSHKKKKIEKNELCVVDGILTYNLDTLFNFIINGFLIRQDFNTLESLATITNKYYKQLDSRTINSLRNVLELTGFNYINEIIDRYGSDVDEFANIVDELDNMYKTLSVAKSSEECSLVRKIRETMK